MADDPDNCSQPPELDFSFDGSPEENDNGESTYTPPSVCIGEQDYSTSECANNDSDYIASLIAENLNMAAGPVNVFPLLGVHSQGSNIDQVGDGYPLSSGTFSGYNVQDAFNSNTNSWRSIQTGADVLTSPAFIGYNFGTKKAWDAIGTPQERYFPPQPERRKISTIRLQQGINAENRATQIRVEVSDDGITWKRMDIINIPNNSNLNTIRINSNAAFQQWRFIPIFFNGVAADESWEVIQLQLLEATQVALDNIEDFFLLENRDRSYLRSSTLLKCTYDLLDVQTELARFGVNIPQTYIFTTSFATMVTILGRPVVVGDIVELPGEMQYDANLKPVRKWLEVTDVGWSTEGYTMNWKPQLFRFYAQPILPSIEHKDILGVPGQVNNEQGDNDILLNGFLQNDLAFKTTEAIEQYSSDSLPETGMDPQDIYSGKPLNKPNGYYDGKDIYVEDAIPPDGAPYTSGDALPLPGTITDGHYHRQTYTNIPISIRPPDRLLKWFADIQRWKVIEVNSRITPESHKKTISGILNSNSIPLDKKV